MQVNIKNPNIFRATLPTIHQLGEHLKSLPFAEMEAGSSLLATYGFLSNPATGELVTPFPGGYAFFFRVDEKIIPASEVKKEFNRRVKVLVDAGTPVYRKDKQAIKDDVIATLAARAFTRPTVVECFYNQTSELLFICGSPKRAKMVLSSLLKCCGTVTTTTIHIDGIKRSLTSYLQGFQNGEGEDQVFEVCETMKLCHPETGEKLSFDDISPSDCAELASAIDRGFLVSSIRLLDSSGMAFTLTDEFRLTQIKWPTIEHEDGDDAAHCWRHEAAAEVLQLSSIVNSLCDILGKSSEANGEAQ